MLWFDAKTPSRVDMPIKITHKTVSHYEKVVKIDEYIDLATLIWY